MKQVTCFIAIHFNPHIATKLRGLAMLPVTGKYHHKGPLLEPGKTFISMHGSQIIFR